MHALPHLNFRPWDTDDSDSSTVRLGIHAAYAPLARERLNIRRLPDFSGQLSLGFPLAEPSAYEFTLVPIEPPHIEAGLAFVRENRRRLTNCNAVVIGAHPADLPHVPPAQTGVVFFAGELQADDTVMSLFYGLFVPGVGGGIYEQLAGLDSEHIKTFLDVDGWCLLETPRVSKQKWAEGLFDDKMALAEEIKPLFPLLASQVTYMGGQECSIRGLRNCHAYTKAFSGQDTLSLIGFPIHDNLEDWVVVLHVRAWGDKDSQLLAHLSQL